LVSYGRVGGARAAEQPRLICGALQMADVPQPVALSLLTEFENHSIFKPSGDNTTAPDTLLDQVVAWRALLHLARRCRWRVAKWSRFPSRRLLEVLKAINPGIADGVQGL
jgi:NAD(P)H-dependent FMN reductase